MSINEKLKKLYSKEWGELENKSKGITNITHPLLIKVNEIEFYYSDIKVIIFGQETDGWHGNFPNNNSPLSVEILMDKYQNYYELKDKYKNKRPFWNKSNFKYFEEEISRYFNNEGKKSTFIWNNLSKIGKTSRGKATGVIREVELKYLNVIQNEIKILAPDIIIFATGHSRDKYIEDVFSKEKVEFIYPKLSFDDLKHSYEINNIMARVRLTDFPNILSIRVEHPNRRTLSNGVIFNVIKTYWEGGFN